MDRGIVSITSSMQLLYRDKMLVSDIAGRWLRALLNVAARSYCAQGAACAAGRPVRTRKHCIPAAGWQYCREHALLTHESKLADLLESKQALGTRASRC